jgi:hypothetical protein
MLLIDQKTGTNQHFMPDNSCFLAGNRYHDNIKYLDHRNHLERVGCLVPSAGRHEGAAGEGLMTL